MKRRPITEDRTTYAWWVHLLMVGCFLVIPFFLVLPEALRTGSGEMPPTVAWALFGVLLLIPFALYFLLGQIRIRVTQEGVEAAWGLSEIIKKRFPYEKILKAEAVTYSPMREFGGWGLRMGMGKKKAWTTRGNRALVLHLTDGSHFYLTSEKPERLVLSILSAGAGKMGSDAETAGGDGG